jgi:hypothetical protein
MESFGISAPLKEAVYFFFFLAGFSDFFIQYWFSQTITGLIPKTIRIIMLPHLFQNKASISFSLSSECSGSPARLT